MDPHITVVPSVWEDESLNVTQCWQNDLLIADNLRISALWTTTRYIISGIYESWKMYTKLRCAGITITNVTYAMYVIGRGDKSMLS